MRIVKIKRVGQGARILPIHVKKWDKLGKSTSFYILVRAGQGRHEKWWELVSFQDDKTGPCYLSQLRTITFWFGENFKNKLVSKGYIELNIISVAGWSNVYGAGPTVGERLVPAGNPTRKTYDKVFVFRYTAF